MKFKIIIVALFLFAINVTAQEISDTSFGKGLINFVAKDSSFSIKFAPRFQVRSVSSWDYNGNQYGSPEHNFIVRRARLKFDGFAYSPKLKYKIELGLSNRDISGANEFNRNTPRYILDAVIMWNFARNWELWAGQTKLPGNVERVVSSANLQLIDRSLLNSRFNIDRDMGFQIRHHFNLSNKFIVREALSFSQGEGRNITTGNLGGHQYTGRLEFLPFGKFTGKGDYSGSDLKFEEKSKLSIGITYDYNNNAVKNRSNQGSYMLIDKDGKIENSNVFKSNISTLFIDAMYKYKGFSFMGEYADRSADKTSYVNSEGDTKYVQVGNSLNLQAGYLLSKTLEVSGRYTNVDWDKAIGKDTENQYTLGVSKYIAGHKLKVQTDISYLDLASSTNELMYRLQVDIHF